MPGLERISFILGSYERRLVSVLKKHITSGMVAYDVGANAGYMTLVMAKLVTPEGQIHSFEPDPKNLRALELNLQTNRVVNGVVCPKAVTTSSGSVTFATFEYSLVGHIAGNTTPDDAVLLDVPSVSIDDWIYRHDHAPPHFMKIDVEGAEVDVLQGASSVLSHIRPIVLCEVRAGRDWEQVKQLMESHRYAFDILEGERGMAKARFGNVLFTPK